MNKRPFWKQANRGFLFSLVLLAAVLVYVLITQLMLIPERNSIRQLAGIYLSMSEQTSALSGEEIEQLKNEDALNQEAERLKKELSKYFVKDSAYIDGAVQPLLDNIQRQVSSGERITELGKGRKSDESILIDQDVAKLSANYTYNYSGKYINYATQQLEDANNAVRTFYLSILFKKTDGEWKIYRLDSAAWDSAPIIVRPTGG